MTVLTEVRWEMQRAPQDETHPMSYFHLRIFAQQLYVPAWPGKARSGTSLVELSVLQPRTTKGKQVQVSISCPFLFLPGFVLLCFPLKLRQYEDRYPFLWNPGLYLWLLIPKKFIAKLFLTQKSLGNVCWVLKLKLNPESNFQEGRNNISIL